MLKPLHFRILRELQDLLAAPSGCPAEKLRKLVDRYAEYNQWGDIVGGVDLEYEFSQSMNLFSESPDGLSFKWTDVGLARFQETEAMQRAWVESPVIPLDDAEKDQIVIQQGESYRGKAFVIQILKRAKMALRIQDNYCSHELFAWLYSLDSSITINIITSQKTTIQDKTFQAMYEAYKQERPSTEVRLSDSVHDRRILIDEGEVFQTGESLKDIGRKGTTIVRIRDSQKCLEEFGSLWKLAQPL